MKKGNLIRTLAILTILLLAAAHATAQVTVTKSSSSAIGVDATGIRTSGGPAAELVKRTFLLNIERSGYLKPAAAGQGSIIVTGAIQAGGGQVSFTCQARMAAGEWLINATYPQSEANAVYAAHQAAHDLQLKATGKPSFFLGQFVMVGRSGNAKDLFLSDSSGQQVRALTQDRSIAVKPRFSGDNTRITYTSFLRKYPDVYSIDLKTGTRKAEAFYPGINSGGAISPDGRYMALILSKDGNPDLYVKDLANGQLRRLTITPRDTEGSPAWSPDGSQIVYVSDASGTYQLYVISRNGGTPTRLTSTGTQNVAPDWGTNGLIAFQTLSGGRFQIAILDPRTRESRIITPFDAAYEDPSWAPDGRHIAAARSVNYQSSIYLLDTGGDAPVRLTAQSGDWTMPAWSR